MNYVRLVPKTLPPGDRVEVSAGRAPSGKQGMQRDGRAEGVRSSIPGPVSAKLQNICSSC